MYAEFDICHNDIKPENILISLSDYSLYVIDFGCGCRQSSHPMADFVGTREYLPPEFHDPSQRRPSQAAVWSLGLTIYEMAHLQAPLDKHDRLESPIPFRPQMSQEFQDLICACLQQNPSDRIPILAILSLPWMKEYDSTQFPTRDPSNRPSKIPLPPLPVPFPFPPPYLVPPPGIAVSPPPTDQKLLPPPGFDALPTTDEEKNQSPSSGRTSTAPMKDLSAKNTSNSFDDVLPGFPWVLVESPSKKRRNRKKNKK